MQLLKQETQQFQFLIWKFYKTNGRDLPWRYTTDPYKIFVSEVMLQQTQVSRVIPKYETFISKFPDFFSLAKSDLACVLRQWSGLGYNRRARYLWESAKEIVHIYKGIVPKDPQLVDNLPGIGRATACSILVFSYNLPLVFIETNIRRVFIQYFFIPVSLRGAKRRGNPNKISEIASPDVHRDRNDKMVDDNELFPLIDQTLDRKNPREWYFALMDYGAFLGKTIENPNKKSAHYTVQSKFEGSPRQVRGIIVRILIKNGSVSIMQLISQISALRHSRENGNPDTYKWIPDSPRGEAGQVGDDMEKNILAILTSLQKDKLIEIKNNRVSIKN